MQIRLFPESIRLLKEPLGALIPMNAAWAMADITIGGMTLINLPACMLLGKVAVNVMKDYEKQKKEGKDPVFIAADIGLPEEELDHWKGED